MAKKFDKDGRCLECGVEGRHHEQFVMIESRWIASHCPDLSLPDPSRDDDPWDPVEIESPLSQLFDPID